MRDWLSRFRGLAGGSDRATAFQEERAAVSRATDLPAVDPRFRADAWFLPGLRASGEPEPLLGFVEIPAGRFWMGNDKEARQAVTTERPGRAAPVDLTREVGRGFSPADPEAFDDEQPAHEVELPAFYMACFPVTVAQFHAFVKEKRSKLGDEDCLRGITNHSVVSISWDEALAYCEWLTGKLREWKATPEPLATLLRKGDGSTGPWRVTLPSEAEWEKSARGTDGRRYPWGKDPDPDRANYDATGINATSAVGCFPGGASVYGVEELSGNVWEWTRSLWGKDWQKPTFTYPYDPDDRSRENLEASRDILRVVRGGAFDDPVWVVRCAIRFGSGPVVRGRYLGFRVVVSPFSS